MQKYNAFIISEVFKVTVEEKYTSPFDNRDQPKDPWTFSINFGDYKTHLYKTPTGMIGYESKKEAEEARNKLIENTLENYVGAVFRNTDTIEYKGHNRLVKIFRKINDAALYIKSQQGYGDENCKLHFQYGINCNGNLYYHENWEGGYDLKIIPLD